MAEPQIVRSFVDAFVVNNPSANASKNYTSKGKNLIRNTGAGTAYTFLYFAKPFPENARVVSAKLYVTTGNAMASATRTLRSHLVSAKWDRNKITYNNQPSVTVGTSIDTTKTGALAANTTWEIDVLPHMTAIAAGTAWWGIRLSWNTASQDAWIHGIASTSQSLRPYLVIEMVDDSDEPTNLRPSNGNRVHGSKPTLDFDFSGSDGESEIVGVRVLVSASPAMTSAWDSGVVATNASELDLAATSYPGLADGSTAYWQAQVTDQSGVVSPLSEVASWVRDDLGTLTLNSPSGTSLTDTTPVISWTLTGETQKQWRVWMRDPQTGALVPGSDSGMQSGTANTWTIPAAAKLQLGKEYLLFVRSWDTKQREANKGLGPYAEVSRLVQMNFGTSVPPVSDLTASRVSPFAWTKLRWYRASAPDGYTIYDGNKVMAVLDADDAVPSTPAGYYEFVLKNATPRKDITWTVVATVNGVASGPNPTVQSNYSASSAYMSEMDGSNIVMFLNYQAPRAKAKFQTVQAPVGGPPVLVRQGEGGINGQFYGILSGQSINGVTVEMEETRINQLLSNEGKSVLLTIINKSIEVFVSNSIINTRVDNDGLSYEVAFDFYETGF